MSKQPKTNTSKFICSAAALSVISLLLSGGSVFAQAPQCDPTKVMTVESCAKCHTAEVNTWKQTPHFQTFEQLHRKPRGKEIAKLMGQKSIKRGNLCINCHYTTQQVDDRQRVVSGVSCESCHGAAKDWLALHNDYGGPTATKESESAAHQQQRFADSVAAGMRNPKNLYLVAQSCLNCHTVPNEALVNHGTHHAGSADFELVAWSQGQVRHNFVRSNGQTNEASSQERLRVMYIVGKIADLEFSTRATAKATERAKYGLTVANRAATVASHLYQIQQLTKDPVLQQILMKFAEAELKINNESQLSAIADRIHSLGIDFADKADGTKLSAIDSMLPTANQYR